MKLTSILCLGLAITSGVPLSVAAQAVNPSSADTFAPVDSARLAAAHSLIDRISPPVKREEMIEAIIRPMMANMRQSFEQSPDFVKLFADQPKLHDEMLSFMDQETERSLKIARESLPSLFDAMAVAYARRFSVDQMGEIQRFFDTPAGRIYADQSPTIMTDPAVQAAQRTMMAKSLDGLQTRIGEMAEKIQASAKKDGAP